MYTWISPFPTTFPDNPLTPTLPSQPPSIIITRNYQNIRLCERENFSEELKHLEEACQAKEFTNPGMKRNTTPTQKNRENQKLETQTQLPTRKISSSWTHISNHTSHSIKFDDIIVYSTSSNYYRRLYRETNQKDEGLRLVWYSVLRSARNKDSTSIRPGATFHQSGHSRDPRLKPCPPINRVSFPVVQHSCFSVVRV